MKWYSIYFWVSWSNNQYIDREKKYDIEDENLERKYKDWQKKLHPDLVHSKSEVSQYIVVVVAYYNVSVLFFLQKKKEEKQMLQKYFF